MRSPARLIADRVSETWHVALTAITAQPRALVVSLVAIAAGAALWLHAAGPGAFAGADFFRAYLAGARAVAAGQNPYHRLVTQTIDTRAGASGLHASGYVYPPLLALALAPLVLAGLDDRAVWLTWTALTAAALVVMGRELNRALRGDDGWAGALVFAAVALVPAVAIYDLWLGQADLLMAALVVIACGRLARGAGWAWAPLSVAIAIKPTMALVLLAWLWLGHWRVALAGALAALALVALPFAVIGLAALRDYVTFATQWNGLGADAEFINQSPEGWLLRAFTANAYTQPVLTAPLLVTPLRLAIEAGAVIVWLRVAPWGRRLGQQTLMATCLAALPLIVLLSPLAEDIHLCIVIPSLVGLGWLAWERGWRRWWASWALWLAFAFAALPRMQELIYPDRWFGPLPGQSDPHVGAWIVLARSGALLFLAVVTLVAGCAVARRAIAESPTAIESQPDARIAPFSAIASP